jgi:hypothetical protein
VLAVATFYFACVFMGYFASGFVHSINAFLGNEERQLIIHSPYKIIITSINAPNEVAARAEGGLARARHGKKMRPCSLLY